MSPAAALMRGLDGSLSAAMLRAARRPRAAGRASGRDSSTVHALILRRRGPKRLPAQRDLAAIGVNYARLLPSTAERVVAFWKT